MLHLFYLQKENPAWSIDVKPGDEPRQNRLRSGQIKRYLDVAQELSAYPILYVGLASGLRQGELISLPWAAVDVCERRVILPKRWVGLSAQAAELIAGEHSWHPDSPEAFLDAKTGQPTKPIGMCWKTTSFPAWGNGTSQSSHPIWWEIS